MAKNDCLFCWYLNEVMRSYSSHKYHLSIHGVVSFSVACMAVGRSVLLAYSPVDRVLSSIFFPTPADAPIFWFYTIDPTYKFSISERMQGVPKKLVFEAFSVVINRTVCHNQSTP